MMMKLFVIIFNEKKYINVIFNEKLISDDNSVGFVSNFIFF